MAKRHGTGLAGRYFEPSQSWIIFNQWHFKQKARTLRETHPKSFCCRAWQESCVHSRGAVQLNSGPTDLNELLPVFVLLCHLGASKDPNDASIAIISEQITSSPSSPSSPSLPSLPSSPSLLASPRHRPSSSTSCSSWLSLPSLPSSPSWPSWAPFCKQWWGNRQELEETFREAWANVTDQKVSKHHLKQDEQCWAHASGISNHSRSKCYQQVLAWENTKFQVLPWLANAAILSDPTPITLLWSSFWTGKFMFL